VRGEALTDTQAEILTLIYALGDAIHNKDMTTASLMQERLLLLYSPLTVSHSHVGTVLCNEATQKEKTWLH
jgi:hypothetical protein